MEMSGVAVTADIMETWQTDVSLCALKGLKSDRKVGKQMFLNDMSVEVLSPKWHFQAVSPN